MGLLDGRVAVVTGAGRGIGRGIALELAREGARVVVNDVGAALDGRGSDPDPADAVCAEIQAAGGQAAPNHDDVADFDGAGRIVATAVEAFGAVDVLVNNAGIVRDRSLLKMTAEDYEAVIAVHQRGTFNCTRHAATHMKEAGYGRIVNITSSAGLRGNFGQTNYGAAKAAIAGMTMVWAIELARYGITVNAMAPVAGTRMTTAILGDASELPPDMDPALNAPMVAFLASERAAHVNGQIVGRRGYGFTIFQKYRPVAVMTRDRPWTAAEVADGFDAVLAEHMTPAGLDVMVTPPQEPGTQAGSAG